MQARRTFMLAAAVAAVVWSTLGAMAVAQVSQPASVGGKEYSNHQDEDALGAGDFLQNILWDGVGGANDAFDYSGSGPPPADPDQVDALANVNDFLFHQVRQGQVPFVASFGGIDDIYYHDTLGATGLWADGPTQINSGAPPDDVDALEIWGNIDANRYSYIGDPIIPGFPAPAGTPAISVFWYDPGPHVSGIYIKHSELLGGLGISPTDPIADNIDIDALMTFDIEGDMSWDPGDWIIFSVWPNAVHDGGEVWVWQNGLPAQFLFHGGRLWDTLNPVATIFGVNSENINAFEAVLTIPEPSSLMLALISLACLYGFGRRRRK